MAIPLKCTPVRIDPFAALSGNVRYLREPDGCSRREAAIPDRDREQVRDAAVRLVSDAPLFLAAARMAKPNIAGDA